MIVREVLRELGVQPFDRKRDFKQIMEQGFARYARPTAAETLEEFASHPGFNYENIDGAVVYQENRLQAAYLFGDSENSVFYITGEKWSNFQAKLKKHLEGSDISYPRPIDFQEAITVGDNDLAIKLVTVAARDYAFGMGRQLWTTCWSGESHQLFRINHQLGFREVFAFPSYFENGDDAEFMVAQPKE
ncbi:hypothetical protein HYV86_04600 [Candidatus Woesearchaeota archaeon]|nr:hypothetical protein [Candidatus Woesearchaeota archaeon]